MTTIATRHVGTATEAGRPRQDIKVRDTVALVESRGHAGNEVRGVTGSCISDDRVGEK